MYELWFWRSFFCSQINTYLQFTLSDFGLKTDIHAERMYFLLITRLKKSLFSMSSPCMSLELSIWTKISCQSKAALLPFLRDENLVSFSKKHLPVSGGPVLAGNHPSWLELHFSTLDLHKSSLREQISLRHQSSQFATLILWCLMAYCYGYRKK